MGRMQQAILFDIDGTLLHAKGLGRPAFEEAFRVAYGAEADVERVSFVGATDTGVVRGLAAECGVESTPAKEERFYIELTKRLEPRLATGDILVYPGVRPFLEALRARGFLLGIVTGSLAQYLVVFAVTQIPLAIAEGLLTVVVFNVLEKYSKTELQQLCVL